MRVTKAIALVQTAFLGALLGNVVATPYSAKKCAQLQVRFTNCLVKAYYGSRPATKYGAPESTQRNDYCRKKNKKFVDNCATPAPTQAPTNRRTCGRLTNDTNANYILVSSIAKVDQTAAPPLNNVWNDYDTRTNGRVGITPLSVPASLGSLFCAAAYLETGAATSPPSQDKATLSIYFPADQQPLLKDFVAGFVGSYYYYVLRTPSAFTAPAYKILHYYQTFTASFVWEPYLNTNSGTAVFQQWTKDSFDHTTGTTDTWNPAAIGGPTWTGSTGGDGFWCSSPSGNKCYSTGSMNGQDYERNLDSWLTAMSLYNAVAYNTAKVYGLQLGVGSNNPEVTGFVQDVILKYPGASFEWAFGY